MEVFASIYLIVAIIFFTIICVIHSDDIASPQSTLSSLESALLVLFISLLWPYTLVWRPITVAWSERGRPEL